MLEHRWNQRHLAVESTIRYELARDGDGTLLKVSHRGLRANDARGYIPGEHAYLDRLEAALSSSPMPNWQARYAEVAGLYGPPPSWGALIKG